MLQNVGLYFGFLATIVALFVGGLAVYLVVTPYHEMKLIRDGNRAAATSFGGTAIGFAIALSSVAHGTYSLVELAVWGVIGLLSQIVVFLIVSRVLPDFRGCIERDQLSYGILMGAISIATGILNAGSLST